VGFIVRRAIVLRRHVMSAWIRLVIITAYPGCDIARDACIESGVIIKAVDGGRVVIENGVHISSGAMIVAKKGNVIISKNTFIGRGSIIVSRKSVTLGESCLIAERVSIRDQNHGTHKSAIPFAEQEFTTRDVNLGNNVWVGAGCVILPGATIESNSVVAANAAVTNDVKSWTIAGGVPAVTIKAISPPENIQPQPLRSIG
jgi:acetyltransferase-like isoleucine patch superfamily enzyme